MRQIAVSLAGTAASTIGATTLQLWTPPGSTSAAIAIRAGYLVPEDGWTLGESTMRRSTVDSQFIRGRQLVDAVEDIRTGMVDIHCFGTDGASLKTQVEHLRVALRQWVYTIGWNYDGFTENWQCEPADLSFGRAHAAVDEFDLSYHEQVVSATIPYFTTDGAL